MKNRIKVLPLLLSLAALPITGFANDKAAKPVQGKVVTVTGSNVVVDVGTQAGIEGGEKMLVTTSWNIINADGKKSWEGERDIGFLRVVAVGPNQSLTELVTGNANKGDRVTLLSGMAQTVTSSQETSRRLTEWLNAYNDGELARWVELWAEDAESRGPGSVIRGRSAIWKDAENVDWKSRRYVETRRVVDGNTAAWEGTWEAVANSSGKEVKLPIVLLIDFNQAGKVTRLNSYYDAKSGFKTLE